MVIEIPRMKIYTLVSSLVIILHFSLSAQCNRLMAGTFTENNGSVIQLTADSSSDTIDYMPTICVPVHVANIYIDSVTHSAFYQSGACSGNSIHLYGAGTYSKNYDTINIPMIAAYSIGGYDNNVEPLLLVRTVTGIDQLQNNLELKCWPNPVVQSLHFEMDLSVPTARITIVNLLGELVYQSEIKSIDYKTEQQINMQTLASGMYILQISAGQSTSYHKIIKQ